MLCKMNDFSNNPVCMTSEIRLPDGTCDKSRNIGNQNQSATTVTMLFLQRLIDSENWTKLGCENYF